MRNGPTLKELGFVKTLKETMSPVTAAMENYECANKNVAAKMAYEVMKRPHIKKMIASQVHVAIDDMVEMREELKKAKTDYAVRYKINADFLDRAGFGHKDTTNAIQVNIYTSDQQQRIAERALRDLRTRQAEGEGPSD